MLRSYFGSILCVLQSGLSSCTHECNEKRARLVKLKLGFANRVELKLNPVHYIYLWLGSSFFLFSPSRKNPNQKQPLCSLSSFFRPLIQNGRRCLSPSAVFRNNLNQERRPCICFTNDVRVPFFGKVLTVVYSLPSPKPVFLFFSITHSSIFVFFPPLTLFFTYLL